MPSDDKNFPLKIFLTSRPDHCSSITKPGMNLLSLLSFAISGKMLLKNREPWVTISSETKDTLSKTLCEHSSEVFQYDYAKDNVTFLITTMTDLNFETQFWVANQRLDIYKSNHLRDFNATKSITVVIKSLKYSTIQDIGNDKLYHELFVEHRHNQSLAEDYILAKLSLPRSQRDYVQTAGNDSLPAVLTAAGIESQLSFFRLCDLVENCSIESLSNTEQIGKSLQARWSQECLNVEMENSNSYSILPSRVDTYFIIVPVNDSTLVTDKKEATSKVDLREKTLNGDGTDSIFSPQTKLVEIEGSLYCPNPEMTTYSEFYVPTLVSSFIHNNTECVKELCDDERTLYFEVRGFNFIGPFKAIWSSACFEEFGYDIVSSIIEAESSGYVTMNKFWAFENYNYLIYSEAYSGPHVESVYLSKAGYALEVLLGVLMVIIGLGEKNVYFSFFHTLHDFHRILQLRLSAIC